MGVVGDTELPAWLFDDQVQGWRHRWALLPKLMYDGTSRASWMWEGWELTPVPGEGVVLGVGVAPAVDMVPA